MGVAAITGGRDRTPTLAELEAARDAIGDRTVRHGACRGTDKVFGDWPACGPKRNRGMLAGEWPGELPRPQVGLLVAFAGGRGTRDCISAADRLGVEVVLIAPVQEPRPWNRHHGDPPGRAVYIGRGTPLGNPYRLDVREGETKAQAAERVLGAYREWLWTQVGPKRPDDRALRMLRDIGSEDYLVCSCWPSWCHAEVVIRAWRWLRVRSQ